MTARAGKLRFFADESALGIGKTLAIARHDVVHAGHPLIPEVRSRMVGDWWAAYRTGGGDAVMIVLRRADVRELNGRAHALRVAAGEVTGPELATPGGAIGVGDVALCRRNDRRLGVRNGDRGTVVVLDAAEGSVELRLWGRGGEGRTVRLPTEYVEAGYLALGYALTGHSAQGMTTGRAFVLGDDAAYREWGYVALSRGREENRLYVVAGGGNEEELDDRTNDIRSALEVFAKALSVSRAQGLAVDQGDGVELAGAAERDRLRGWSDAELVSELRRLARRREPDCPRPDLPTHALRDAERGEQDARRHLEAARRSAAELRGRLESEGLLSRVRRREERRIDERMLRTDEETRLPQLEERWRSAAQTLADLHERAAARARWEAERDAIRRKDLARGMAIRDELRIRDRNLGRAAAADRVRFAADPPVHVVAALGACPHGAGAQRLWHEAAEELARHRRRHGITDPDRPLGDLPSESRDAAIARLVHRTRAAIDTPLDVSGERSMERPRWRSTELDELIAAVRARDVERARRRAADRSRHRAHGHEHDVNRGFGHRIGHGQDGDRGVSIGW